jgi:outer membrane phospholipase A
MNLPDGHRKSQRKEFWMSLTKISTLVCLLNLFSVTVFADGEMDLCLQRAVLNAGDDETIGKLREGCIVKIEVNTSGIQNGDVSGNVYGDVHGSEIRNLSKFRFQSYKDNYLTIGKIESRSASQDSNEQTLPFDGETTDIKFRFGFSYPILSSVPELRFGYSQKSFWNVSADSKPFWDHNFNPEVFYTFLNTFPEKKGFLRVGLEHESNGEDNLDSREWNRFYVKYERKVNRNLEFGLKSWWAITDDGNKHVVEFDPTVEPTEIVDFLGYAELGFKLRVNDHIAWQFATTKGKHTSKFNYQSDFILSADWFAPDFFLTIYDGYGESLRTYDVKTTSVRLGVRFSPN